MLNLDAEISILKELQEDINARKDLPGFCREDLQEALKLGLLELQRVGDIVRSDAGYDALSRPLQGFDPESEHPFGLHKLKDRFYQTGYLPEQCASLAKEKILKEVIATTNREAPKPRGDYRICNRQNAGEKTDFGDTQNERRLETAIFSNCRTSVDKLWDTLITYQLPLFASSDKERWGYVDLFGLLGGCPVVVELKTGLNPESPLRPLLEAASYAVAIKKVWAELSAEIRKAQPSASPAENATQVHLVLLAPRQYWKRWTEQGTAQARKMATAAESYRELVSLLSDKWEMPVHFATVDDKHSSLEVSSFDFLKTLSETTCT